jgi:plastocyanin
MRKRTTALLITIVGLVMVLGIGPARAAAKTTINLGDNFFAPSSKTIAAGTTVRFNWIGSNPHNVKKARGPGGNFKSKTKSRRGVNFAKRFDKAGVYRLICTIHPEEMRLKLTVR